MALFTRVPRATATNASKPPTPSCPSTISYQGRPLLLSGKGRSPGSWAYMDLSQNRTYELFLAQVQGVTLDGLMATVPGNAALRYVLVQQPAIHGNSVPGPGAWLLIGSLDIAGGSPPRAHTAWLLGSSAPNRKHGTITRIHHSGAFGEITDPQGKKLFFHVSELPPGSSVHVGQRVSYVEGLNAKGWLARRVRPD